MALAKNNVHPTSGRALPWLLLVCVSVLILNGCQASADSPNRGKQLFATCSECHGESGEGNAAIGAPNIAGMNAWYIETELHKFRAGVRGAEFDDMEGMRMRPMSLSLENDADVKAVAGYVASLPPVPHPPILGGDPLLGKRRYALCSGCHGPSGSGNEAIKAPRLAGVDDWYLATELKKFHNGVRGADPRDVEGSAMAPMTRALNNDKVIRDLSAYASTLKGIKETNP
jgi:cytochrome c oxidase subunit 2